MACRRLSNYRLNACVLAFGKHFKHQIQTFFYNLFTLTMCFLSNIKKFVFCGKCVVKMENSLGERA